MTAELDRLCEESGIEGSYISETGEHRWISDDVKFALLRSLGPSGRAEREDRERLPSVGERRCFVPAWLDHGRCWGVTVQLFGVRSGRNHGIGDFEDAARLAELLGPLGADFLGINPIHALFPADPWRKSPYFPSSRAFLNPLYIALDRLDGAAGALAAGEVAILRAGQHVDYGRVAHAKFAALERAFDVRGDHAAFDAYRNRGGDRLESFATFEALGAWLVAQGQASGWLGWPTAFQRPDTPEVAEFRRAHADRIRFHAWLQWIAAGQLADAQRRARASGMRIGLYLDLAVGVAPDGAATWSRPACYAEQARIGAPPDLFNAAGQDWGLAPIKPSAFDDAPACPFEDDLAAAMASAGAVRLDHAMGLKRLYLIPPGFDARSGAYVRYPFKAILEALADRSQAASAVVIGEDLGTVPPGFREAMETAGLFGYRVFYFEQDGDGRFRPPGAYPRHALACVATHDLPPLAGWWRGGDIDARADLGRLAPGDAEEARAHRLHSRAQLLAALAAEGLAPSAVRAEDAVLSDDTIVNLHRFLARTPCRMLAVQLEDLTGATELVNLPGTHEEYRNWSLRLPIAIEDLAAHPLFRHTLTAVASERPRPPPP